MEHVQAVKVAIVGGGPGCKAIMDMIFAEKLGQLRMKLIGVACTNPQAVGYVYAQEKGIFTTRDYRDLYELKGLNMIVELTGHEEVANEIGKTKPHHVRLMDHVAARLFWDIFQIEEARIAERMETEKELKKHRDHLDDLVKEKTAKLMVTKDHLQQEFVECELAQAALRKSERNYRSIIDTMVDIFYRADLRGKVILASTSAVKLLGYDSTDELIGKNLAKDFYYRPEDRKIFLRDLEKSGQLTNYAVTLKRKDGTPVVGETSSHFVCDESGKPIAIEGIFRDITDRRKAEKERVQLIFELSEALSKVRTLSGLLPICTSCKKIRDDNGYWNRIEEYIRDHSEAKLSHSICPECAKTLYPMQSEENK